MAAYGVADAVAVEGLLPRTLYAHGPAAELSGQPGTKRLIQRVLLVAEAAAYVGLDDAHLPPGNAQGLADDAADDVRYLCGGDDHDAAALHIGPAVVIFDVAVLDGGRVVPAFDLDEPRLLDGRLVVANPHAAVTEDIPRESLVQLRRARLHCLLDVKNEGQRLVLDLYLPQGLLRRKLVLRDDHGDLVAPEADVVREQQPVRHVLVLRLRRPGVARGREIILRHIEAGEDCLDPIHRPRFLSVDALYQRVGLLRVKYLCRQRPPIAEVGGVHGAACGLVARVHARHGSANIAQAALPLP